MATMLMISPLLGALGKGLKPVPFLVLLVPVLAVMTLVAALHAQLAWYSAAGLFYAGLALAELGYLGALCLWSGDGVRLVDGRTQDRNA